MYARARNRLKDLMPMTIGLLAAAALLASVPAASMQSEPPAGEPQTRDEPPVTVEPVNEPDPMAELIDELSRLLDEVQQLRVELAQARLDRAEAVRELNELQQFIEDHDRLGDAYEQYRGIKAIKEREAHQREMQRRRAEYERERAKRRAKYLQARAERQAEQAERHREAGYGRAGFANIGLDVYFSRASFHYGTKTTSGRRFIYEPDELDDIDDFFYRSEEIDFTKMTISGSVLNGADVTRNIGVAIVFFDEYGAQVGHEIVQINNARPDVPYPFTSTVQLALNRPFSSTSQYVLYADPVAVASNGESPGGEGQ